ncbi:efflux RND transporter periplasmic adaptor subunit [Bacteroides sp. 519]|uniref:efflux RND transporter periplasmic adaptor subunit n=1 Tax=Bacteroides sp. 519 TaxID=2302937 RepID=UPI0013D45BF3|nr:efflux RND transporter periplasmic adaptor subunit [Bacteroides sp. 519]NDV60132.1 efflux RND transporter periplasmic adaptor subunit [Bacteroides sp. 519]
MDKRVRWGIVFLIIAGLTVLGIYRFYPKTNKDVKEDGRALARASNAKRVLNVNGFVVKQQTLVINDDKVRGRLIPDEEVDLSFQTSGMVTHIEFKEGASVKKGQLLAKVNDAPLQAQLKKLEAQLKLAEDRVYRQSTLLEKDAVSKEAYEQVRTDLESLKADIQLVKANIDLTELRAPFDGIIGLRQISEGAYASPSTVLAKLTKVIPLKLEFAINEKNASLIKPGAKIAFTIDNNLNTFYGSVYATEALLDPVTNTLPVRAIYPNYNGALLPGRTATIQIIINEINDAIAIPSEAIVPELGRDIVYLYRNGKATPVTVTKGVRTDAFVQIVDGLHVGDTIITSGTLQLRTGLNVFLDNIN